MATGQGKVSQKETQMLANCVPFLEQRSRTRGHCSISAAVKKRELQACCLSLSQKCLECKTFPLLDLVNIHRIFLKLKF